MRDVTKRIEQEKLDWDKFLEKKKKFGDFMKDKKQNLERIKATRLLEYYEEGFLEPDYDKPIWKYAKEQAPRIAVVLDDTMGTDLMNKPSSKLTNFAIKLKLFSAEIFDLLGNFGLVFFVLFIVFSD